MLVHSGDKQYPCKPCPKTFTSSGKLKKHMLIHNGEKPYPCMICPKSFTGPGSLKKPLLIHSWEKPHGCQLCILSSKFCGCSCQNPPTEKAYEITALAKPIRLFWQLRVLFLTEHFSKKCTFCDKIFKTMARPARPVADNHIPPPAP